ncbi:NAD-dependent epimerase/dehydratase family protein [Pseudenhygromyxa sp. WMMC2535]|uniref:NAD-dependent epimerase/dehydratase family protein n=1 Tax=Pseudenhygromyxa sp. WMMC2535 TaxID=2712867 RepID=UPI0015554F4F|nr:NAD-dependent epimerase/dehydratase family protein [Pseudenhygromyxa sp. WMMC2535]NVB41397.1 NAD-dependent epimerase/dehydratase family protein [Pseudenhygromyxa sp. WMMC2535]
MRLSRRAVVSGLGVALASATLGCRRDEEASSTPESAPTPSQPGESGEGMHVLILGGTGFLGPHFVREALARGHRVTLFNRGKTNPHLFPELEKLRGDRRAGDLQALEGRRFDAVVDTSGYLPQNVAATAGLLADSGQYLFVSSVSVYRDQGQAGLTVGDPVAPHPEPGNDDVAQFYGPLKALCEQAAEDQMPGRTTVIRPGLIVGPGDPTDRFTYWPVRLARGGEVMAPGRPEDPVQLIDARDLAAFMVHCLEARDFSTYNAVGPAERLGVGEMLRVGAEALGSSASFVWVPAPFLAEQEVAPWVEMTVWVPPEDPEFGGLGSVDGSAAVAAGLRHRPLAETFVDTLADWRALPEARREAPRAGLPAAREAEVLAAWRARQAEAEDASAA